MVVSFFQQDNAPCHIAKIVQEWFEEHGKEFNGASRLPRSQSKRVPVGCLDKHLQSTEASHCNIQD